jgi:hypothetical protein
MLRTTSGAETSGFLNGLPLDQAPLSADETPRHRYFARNPLEQHFGGQPPDGRKIADDVIGSAEKANAPMPLERRVLIYDVVPIPLPDGGAAPRPMSGEVLVLPMSGAAPRPMSGDEARMQTAGKVVNCLLSEKTELAWGSLNGYMPSRQTAAEQVATDKPMTRSPVDAAAAERPYRPARQPRPQLQQGFSAPCPALYRGRDHRVREEGITGLSPARRRPQFRPHG